MCRLTRNNILIMAFMFYGVSLAAQNQQNLQDSVRIYFKQGKIDLVPTLRENRSALNRITDTMRITGADSAYHLRKILVEGGASPEGSVKFNRWLSEKRAKALFDYLSHYGELPDSLKTTRYLGRDWNGLIRLVENDPQLPYKEETLSMLRQIASEQKSGAQAEERHLQKIQKLRGGTPYLYMYRKYFPLLRSSKLHLWYEKVHRSEIPKPENLNSEIQKSDTTAAAFIPPADTIVTPPDTQSIASQRIRKPFYMDIRTNMLYDALLIPNIGVEMYLGKKWSVTANWMYGWWKTDRRHWYWRAYGGDIAIRKWWGKASEEKPLTGHHIGIYGQIFTYDFETGGRGYMGGKPGGTLWDKMNYIVGAEYGYSLPIARRLNIDFTIGAGYWGGIYHEYKPEADYYVWQSTKERRWIGPTKAEISLVWLIGNGNTNRKFSGRKNREKGGGNEQD